MNFIPVEKIPNKKTGRVAPSEYKPMASYLKEFMKMNTRYVRVSFASLDYANIKSAATGFRAAVRRSRLPIKVSVRDEDIYLMRTDMED